MKLKPKLLSLLQHRKKEFPRERIIADLTAGLVVACIALPLSIALAIASGVTPDKGLITGKSERQHSRNQRTKMDWNG